MKNLCEEIFLDKEWDSFEGVRVFRAAVGGESFQRGKEAAVSSEGEGSVGLELLIILSRIRATAVTGLAWSPDLPCLPLT